MKMESLPPNKTKVSFFRLTRCTPVEEAEANEKKRESFSRLIRQMHLILSFSRTATWTNEEKGLPFSPPNKKKTVADAPATH